LWPFYRTESKNIQYIFHFFLHSASRNGFDSVLNRSVRSLPFNT
jgi:hypothetical protein